MKKTGTASVHDHFTEFLASVIRHTPRDLDPTVMQGWIENQSALGKVLREALAPSETTTGEHVVNCDAAPFVPDGLTVEEHKKGGQRDLAKTGIELFLAKKQKKDRIGGNDLRKELEGKPVLNANVLDYLLAHPELIPAEWKGKAVFFWGTTYRSRGGYLCVRYLYWRGGRWYSDYGWLGSGWDVSGPAACAQASA